MKKDEKILRLTIAAVMAALTCVATMIIRIPTPGTSGYIHLGDALVVLCGIFLGPVYGGLAAGIGSAMSDLLGGYLLYVPVTFVVKGLVAVVVAIVFRKFAPAIKPVIARCALCGVFSTVIVAVGYLVFEVFIYGAAAFASVPSNIIQGISGLVISCVLVPVLMKVPVLRELKS